MIEIPKNQNLLVIGIWLIGAAQDILFEQLHCYS
jgi:hypothetical protein